MLTVDRRAPMGGSRVLRFLIIVPSTVRQIGGCSAREDIAEALSDMGALLEWSSVNLLAVDAEDPTRAQKIADYLAVASDEGKLMLETGRS